MLTYECLGNMQIKATETKRTEKSSGPFFLEASQAAFPRQERLGLGGHFISRQETNMGTNKTTKHPSESITPGPWDYDFTASGIEVTGANGNLSVVTFNDNHDSALADAKLTAAAPEMRDLLRELADHAARFGAVPKSADKLWARVNAVIEKTIPATDDDGTQADYEANLADAEGGQP